MTTGEGGVLIPTTKKEKSKSSGGASQKSSSGSGGGVDLFSGLGPSDLNHALDTDLDLFGPDSLLSGNLLPDLPAATGTRKSSSRSSVLAKSATTASNNRASSSSSTSAASSTALTTAKNKQYSTQPAQSPRALPSTDTASMYEELIQQRTAQVSQNYDPLSSPSTIGHY